MGTLVKTEKARNDTADGVYLLANDVSFDWVLALTRSLRRSDPELPLFIIPFDANTRRLQQYLKRDPHAHFWADPAVLAECDRLAALLGAPNPVAAGMFRKFACFDGPLQKFTFLDADIVLRGSISLINTQLDAGKTAMRFLQVEHLEEVFRGETAADFAMNGSPVYNAGVFRSHAGALVIGDLQAAASDGTARLSDFVSGEQSFLNWICAQQDLACSAGPVTKERRSFAVTWAQRALPEADLLPLLHWAGEPTPSPKMSHWAEWSSCRLDGASLYERVLFMYWTVWARPRARRLKQTLTSQLGGTAVR